MEKRSRIEVIAEILDAADTSPINATSIMKKVRLSSNQLSSHLNFLLKPRLLSENEKGMWKTTDNGRVLLFSFLRMKRIPHV